MTTRLSLLFLLIIPVTSYAEFFNYQIKDNEITIEINDCNISSTWSDIENNLTIKASGNLRELTLYIKPENNSDYIYEIHESCTKKNIDYCKDYSSVNKIIQNSELLTFCNDSHPNCATHTELETKKFSQHESLGIDHLDPSSKKQNLIRKDILRFIINKTQDCKPIKGEYKHRYQLDILKIERRLQVELQDENIEFKTAQIYNSGFAGQRLVCATTHSGIKVMTDPFTKELIIHDEIESGDTSNNESWERHCTNQISSEEILVRKIEQKILKIKPNHKIANYNLYGQQELKSMCGTIEDQSSHTKTHFYYGFSNTLLIENKHSNFQKNWDANCSI
ncbi:hypothetical protein [Marinicellulosiphila megalodicopiae]|uniref:hypothetical protein n=1 Tax=Marinicellulosiphila megalodicopiae TaxID=2724896 RepID=UPI003BB16C1D